MSHSVTFRDAAGKRRKAELEVTASAVRLSYKASFSARETVVMRSAITAITAPSGSSIGLVQSSGETVEVTAMPGTLAAIRAELTA